MIRNDAMVGIGQDIMFKRGLTLAELMKKPSKHGDGCTVWLPPDKAHDEWARVLLNREKTPYVPFVPSNTENNKRRWAENKGLERRGHKLGVPSNKKSG